MLANANNRSSFYAWRQRQGRANPERDKLKAALVRHHKASRESAGARTLSKELQAKGHRIGRYMARSLMREAGIASRQRRRHKYKSPGVEALVAPHVLKRQFDVTAVNQVWCGDVTYIKVGKRWMYFAAVLDLYARRIVGWSFSMISDANLTCEALRMAVEWALLHQLDAVIWTALPPKFEDIEGLIPTVDDAVSYLAGLSADAQEHARDYIRRVPAQIDTSYRREINSRLGWQQ